MECLLGERQRSCTYMIGECMQHVAIKRRLRLPELLRAPWTETPSLAYSCGFWNSEISTSEISSDERGEQCFVTNGIQCVKISTVWMCWNHGPTKTTVTETVSGVQLLRCIWQVEKPLICIRNNEFSLQAPQRSTVHSLWEMSSASV